MRPRTTKNLPKLIDPRYAYRTLISLVIWIVCTWVMAGSVRTCCVPKCGRTRVDMTLHSFPDPEKEQQRFVTWVNAVGGTIASLEPQYIYRNRKICDDHFEQKYKTWKGRLNKLAVPTLLMPGFQVVSNTFKDITNTEPIPKDDMITSTSKGVQVVSNILKDITNTEPIPKDDMIASTSEGVQVVSNILKDITNTEPIPKDDMIASTSEGPAIKLKVHANPTDSHIGIPSSSADSIPAVKQLLTSVTAKQSPHNQRKGPAFKDDKAILKQMLKKATKKNMNYAARLKKAMNLQENKTFQKVINKFTQLAALFITMQFREIGKDKMGRRFTENEKIMAVSLYKQGPKLYRYLSKAFVLPSPQTLSRLIARADLRAGINEKLFKVLKKKVKRMKADDKLCVLLFDEMAITPHFDYNPRKDAISGFVNNGKNKEKRIADHALVFMIRGVTRNYRQPIAYTFCSGSTKTQELANILTEIIKKLHSVGLQVLATVCDQGASNVSCINHLIGKTKEKYINENKEYRRQIFEIDDKEIIPLYDPPHLLKGIRNNLLTKDLKYTMDGETKIAKWEHLVLLHKEDPSYKGIRLMKKLTDDHINPDKVKMKVKFATQIFSQNVAVTMGYFADKGVLPEECKGTADVLLFFDRLFDSVNGSLENSKKRGKILLQALKPGSMHNEVWSSSKKILSTMKFINKGKEVHNPSLKNWLHTIDNIEYLRDVLFQKYDIKSVWMRHFNQDPLENFFGCIRSHGCRNINPTPVGFETAFASLLISNLTGSHSPGNNCEEDSCTTMFKSMKDLFRTRSTSSTSLEIDLNYLTYNIIVDFNKKKENPRLFATLQYVTGYILRKVKKHVFKNCVLCKKNFYSQKTHYEYLNLREYNKRKTSLQYPNEEFIETFSKIQDLVYWVLENYSDIEQIRNYIKTLLYVEIDLKFNSCETHKKDITDFIFDLNSKFFLYNWCKDVNNILRGRRKDTAGNDIIKKLAIEYCNKRKK